MTNESINIAVAESRGYKVSDHLEYGQYGIVRKDSQRCIDSRRPAFEKNGILCDYAGLPNYCSSRDAMAEAINSLDDDQVAVFAKHLKDITKPVFGTSHYRKKWWANFIKATGRQRAEAYLKTINKWKK